MSEFAEFIRVESVKAVFKQIERRLGCSAFWLTLLFLLTAILLISSAVFAVLIEDLQMLAFPLILFCFWRLPLSAERRVPAFLLIFSLLLWICSVGAAFGLYSFGPRGQSIYLSRLENDSSGLRARAIYQRYNQIARTYHLPRINLVQLSFSNDINAAQWLHERPDVPFVLRGTPEWLRVVFPSDSSRFVGLYPGILETEDIPQEILSRAEALSLSPGRNVFILKGPLSGQYFAVEYQPEVVTIPGEPEELARHSLAWFGAALRSDLHRVSSRKKCSMTSERERAVRADAWFEASKIDGLWKSKTAQGVAYYFLGTQGLLEGQATGFFQPRALALSLDWFRKAAGCFSANNDASFYAAVFNNAAIALLFSGTEQADLQKARFWLEKALHARPSESSGPVLGVRVAIFNLMALEEAAALG